MREEEEGERTEQGREEGKEGMREAGGVAEVASSTLMCTHTHIKYNVSEWRTLE